ncbi:MAG: transcriptional regulator, LysR family [Verrucomicrobia bacterium]|nr:transcriptional regulator, LysR family [Verrucomicrobiota bacterium]
MKTALTMLAGLSIERLRSFCLIVDAGSFVEAAQRNPVRQSQFSRQMRDLERTLGAQLFVREGRHLRLTANGIRLAALTRAYFGALQSLREEDIQQKPIKLGAGESIIRWFLIPRIQEIIAAAGAPVILENYTTEEIWKKLEQGELDVGILRADAVRGSCTALAFPSITYVLMVPKAFAGTKKGKAMRELPIAILGSEVEFENNATRLAHDNGYALKIQVRAKSFNLVTAIANNLNVAAFVPSAAQSEFSPDRFVRVDLKGIRRLTRPLAVAYNQKTAELNERARQFAMTLSNAYAGFSG